MKSVTLSVFYFRCEQHIKIEFAYDATLVNALKKTGGKWSKTHSCWYVAYKKEHYNMLIRLFKDEYGYEVNIITSEKSDGITEQIEASGSVHKNSL